MQRAIKRLYNIGIYPEWWKLQVYSEESWRLITETINKTDPYCQGVVLLGLNESIDNLKPIIRIAKNFDLCKGFAVGRTLFDQEVKDWFLGKISDTQFQRKIIANYQQLIEVWLA